MLCFSRSVSSRLACLFVRIVFEHVLALSACVSWCCRRALSAQALAIVMVATAIGLPCGRQAHAQGPGSGAALVIGIASLADDEITDLCSRKFIANSAAWNVCIATAFDMRDKLTNVLQNGSKDQPRQLPSRPAAKGRAAASVRSTPATT